MSKMVDIVPESINRIRLNDDELILLNRILKKIDINELRENEKKLHKVLLVRIEGRLKAKEEGIK